MAGGKIGLDFVTTAPAGLTPQMVAEFESLPERFKSKVTIGEGCWEWTAYKLNGYGRYRRGGRKAGVAFAHRWIYEQLIAEIPTGKVLDHLCRNRGCVRPDHLEVVTIAENNRRGRFRNHSGYCRSGRHEWTGENILEEGGRLRCRPCRDERELNYRPPKGNLPGDRTHCPQGHEYSPENTSLTKSAKTGAMHRQCKECHRIRSREAYRRKKREAGAV